MSRPQPEVSTGVRSCSVQPSCTANAACLLLTCVVARVRTEHSHLENIVRFLLRLDVSDRAMYDHAISRMLRAIRPDDDVQNFIVRSFSNFFGDNVRTFDAINSVNFLARHLARHLARQQANSNSNHPRFRRVGASATASISLSSLTAETRTGGIATDDFSNFESSAEQSNEATETETETESEVETMTEAMTQAEIMVEGQVEAESKAEADDEFQAEINTEAAIEGMAKTTAETQHIPETKSEVDETKSVVDVICNTGSHIQDEVKAKDKETKDQAKDEGKTMNPVETLNQAAEIKAKTVNQAPEIKAATESQAIADNVAAIESLAEADNQVEAGNETEDSHRDASQGSINGNNRCCLIL